MNFGTGDFSIDAWIKTTAFPSIVNNMGLFGGYRLYINASHQLVLQLGLATIGAVTVIGPSISSGQWNFVGVVVNRSTSKVSFYSKVAGSSGPLVPVMVFQNFAGVSATSSQPLDIGRAAGPPLAGITIDELELFNRVVTSEEFRSIFAAGPKGKCWGTINPH